EKSQAFKVICISFGCLLFCVGALTAVMYARQLNELSKVLRSPCHSSKCQASLQLVKKMMNPVQNADPCHDFFDYACGGWSSNSRGYRTFTDELIANFKDTADYYLLHSHKIEDEKDPSYDLITFYGTCIDFLKVAMPFPVLVRKAIALLDLSFTEWFRNDDPLSLFFFVVRLSLTHGIDTLLKFDLIKDSTGSVIRLAPPSSVEAKMAGSKTHSDWMVYMVEIMYAFGLENITFDVTMRILEWDEAVGNITKTTNFTAKQRYMVNELPTVPNLLKATDWLEAINDNLDYSIRLKNVSQKLWVAGMDSLKVMFDFYFKPGLQSDHFVILYVFVQAVTELLRFDFNRDVMPQWTCLKLAYANFRAPLISFLGEYYVGNIVNGEFESLFTKVRQQVTKGISRQRWIGADIALKTQIKASNVTLLVLKQNTADTGYGKAPMTNDFMKNYVKIVRLNKEDSNRYPRPDTNSSDDLELLIGVLEYDYLMNRVRVPSVMMVPPLFFNSVKEPFVDMSTVGARLASAVIKSFLREGSNYEPGGLKQKWWSQKQLNAFSAHTDCLMAQNLPQWYGPVTSAVKDELVSSVWGLAVAHSLANVAGKKTLEKHFFLRYCQQFCTTHPDDNVPGLSLSYRMACHLPLLNLRFFRRAFECANGSILAPQITCHSL
ncbi:unnamed protein product, partial [Ixodes persulcatus]